MTKVVINVRRDWSTVAIVLSDLNQTSTYRQILLNPSNITFHENPSKGSQVVPLERKGWTDMEHITGDFLNFENLSKTESVPHIKRLQYRLHERVGQY